MAVPGTDRAGTRQSDPPPLVRSRLVIIGDVGGHLETFSQALTDAGCDVATGTVPAGTTIIQVGDLVHRGPDSDGCVEVANRFLTNPDRRYLQLFGNHEGHELGGPMMDGYDNQVGPEAKATLKRWWATGAATLATAVDLVDHGPLLVLHGGLTVRRWQSIGSPTSPTVAADRLNSDVGRRPSEAFRAGLMLADAGRDAGPTWASAGFELYGQWLQHPEPPPFGQIHGHSSGFRWSDGVWRPGTPQPVRAATTSVDSDRRHTWTAIGERWFIGIDPGHGSEPAPRWSPLVLEGSIAPPRSIDQH